MVGLPYTAPFRSAKLGQQTQAGGPLNRMKRVVDVGLILADTKFEFGLDRETGVLTLCDEVLTSDSSRYWDAATYGHLLDITGGKERIRHFAERHAPAFASP